MARKKALVAAAEFDERADAEEAWSLLTNAGIPANVETDPGPLGRRVVTRVFVHRRDLDEAQRVLAPFVTGLDEAGS